MPFVTPTGQTGRDAYIFELASIRNARRELDDRANRLFAAMNVEIPADAVADHTFGSRAREIDRETIGRMLDHIQYGADVVPLEVATEIARTLR